MKIVKCKHCDRDIPFDSTLCPYCGNTFNEFRNLINDQKKKQINMAKINETKMELIKNSVRPVKLKMSNMGQSEQLNDNIKISYMPKLIKYLIIFSMFITLLIVMAIIFG